MNASQTPCEPSVERFPRWRSITWPNDATVSVQILLAFEAFVDHSQFTTERSDGHNPFSLSYGEYGAHVGVWRLLQMLEDEGVKASVAINGLAAERYPEAVAAMVAGGHEPVGHAWANDRLMLGGVSEREDIANTIHAIEAAGGQRPLGWTSPGKMGSLETERNLLDHGIQYTGDDASDDLPFVKDVDGRPFAVVPSVDLASNDLRHWVRGFHGPQVLEAGFRTTFDSVHEEASRGRAGAVGLVLHCHVAGRPTLLPVARDLIRYAKRHQGVWFARGCDIAQWALENDFRR
jgi:peptidoglycan/xylan/chitin deacetylase (PgdA/CDA1 family)